MALSPAFQKALQRQGGDWEHSLSASKVWTLTFFSGGPPPIAVSRLRGKREEDFYKELVKLSDIQKMWDARAILIAMPGALTTDAIQLATNAGIYTVLDGDCGNLEAALGGREVSEVNRAAQVAALGKRRRSASQECRSLELDLLSKRWMTLRELEEQLQWRFDRRTVRAQARSLQRQGKLCVCGRTSSAEGLLGIPSGRYRVRPDLSAPTISDLISKEIVRLVGAGKKPLGYRELSDRLGVKPHVATASLRGLARKGMIEKRGPGWVLAGKNLEPRGKGAHKKPSA